MSQSDSNRFLPLLREIGETIVVLWWAFFDWLALVSWRNLAIICVIVVVLAGMLGAPQVAVMFAFLSFGVKVLAGGKRRADLAADAAITRANVEALERRLLEAQMATLQAQVEPHFLFNTLALIGQLIETDPPQAARIHTHLIQYLRSALPQMRDQGGGTLGRQIELSRAYLTIMQARMRDRLTVAIELPEGLADAPFPPMMIQTLVENAIKHGLEPKTQGGHIDIRASVRDKFLHVEVIDNGVGFNLHAGDGIGLANIRERLKMLFGAGAQLIIEAPAQGGAYTCIRVPYQKNGSR
ncbi:sensor histidine kinase [Undibacterium sp.]|jgi:LytS/YehU family sensor histidine kinase|uniref:sensor histidine kinase n=1 Tax=Undibacterium sp. TaxID=1914977 RepID=UPI002B6ABDAE|nr:histidine kinase [Undibacterium sp.]HTD04038.1 histidine kinase [Undibacterium sp.]